MQTKEKRTMQYGEEARKKLLSGIEKTAQAVQVTLGPKGRNVMIESQYNYPHVTKDGVTVASQIALSDPTENIGSIVIQEAAGKAAYYAGDGTTTATVLAAGIVRNIFEEIQEKSYLFGLIKAKSNKDINLVEVKKGIDAAVQQILRSLKHLKIEATPEIVTAVATVSANGDKTIGTVVGDAVNRVGAKGSVTVIESPNNVTKVEFAEGYQLNSGWFDAIFVNKHKNMSAEYNNAGVLIIDGMLNKIADIANFLNVYENHQKQHKKNEPLIIVATGFQGEVLATLLNSKQNGSEICAVKAPSIGEQRTNFLRDLALYTGGEVIGDDTGHRIKNFKMDWLGSVEKVMINQNKAVFCDGAGNQDKIDQMLVLLENQFENATESQTKHLEDRIAALQSLVAVIEVASSSSIELREVMDRVDDSVKSAKSALEEGVIIGGGSAFVKAFEQNETDYSGTESEVIGYASVYKAILNPLRQICENSGISPEYVISQVMGTSDRIGYNALTNEVCDLREAGILDPLKVSRIALESAASVAGTLITTECVMTFENRPDPANEPR